MSLPPRDHDNNNNNNHDNNDNHDFLESALDGLEGGNDSFRSFVFDNPGFMTQSPGIPSDSVAAAAAVVSAPVSAADGLAEETVYRSLGTIATAEPAGSSAGGDFWNDASLLDHHDDVASKQLDFAALSLAPMKSSSLQATSFSTVLVDNDDDDYHLQQQQQQQQRDSNGLSSDDDSLALAPFYDGKKTVVKRKKEEDNDADEVFQPQLLQQDIFSSRSHDYANAVAMAEPVVLESSHLILSQAPSDIFAKILGIFASYGIAADGGGDDATGDEQQCGSISHDVSILKVVTARYKVKASVVPSDQFSSCTFQCQIFTCANDPSKCILEFQRRSGCSYTFQSLFRQIAALIDDKVENPGFSQSTLPLSPSFHKLSELVATLDNGSAFDDATSTTTSKSGNQSAVPHLVSMSESRYADVAHEGLSGLQRMSSSKSALNEVAGGGDEAKEVRCIQLLKSLTRDDTSGVSSSTAVLDQAIDVLGKTSQVSSFQARLLKDEHSDLIHTLAMRLNTTRLSTMSQRNIVLTLRNLCAASHQQSQRVQEILKRSPSQYNQIISLLQLFSSARHDRRLATFAADTLNVIK